MAFKSYDIVLIFPPIRTWDSPRNFPAGIGLIAARLRSAGYHVAVIDVNGLRLSDEEVLEKLQRYNPLVIGVGGLITTYGWVKRMTRRIRQLLPDGKIILGGSVGTSIVATALKNLGVDVIVVGEADDTILEVLPAILNARELDGIAGLAYLHDGKIVRTADRKQIGNLDDLPYPAWDMFPMEVYLANPVVGVGKDIDIISSRGCPFGCRYCYRLFGRKFRGRSAEHIVGEMAALKRNYDVDFISFQDDCFVVDKKRVFEVCDLIDRHGLSRSLRWSCTGRVTMCDKDMLQRMRACGCVSVSYGIESGSEEILKAMDKGASLEQAKEAIRNTRQTGMRSPVSFMIGYPGETRRTVMETVEFCREMNIPLTSLMFTCPYPGTVLYEEVKESERFRKQFATEEEFVLKMGDAVDLTVNLTDMSDEQLLSLRDEALEATQRNYRGPSTQEAAAHEKELYGEQLYYKGKEQLGSGRLAAHRQRHGFNENIIIKPQDKKNMPGWVDRRVHPYVIAEAGVNHNGKLETAIELVDAAREAGANCVKFQAFYADELAVRGAPKAQYQEASGKKGESQYEMLKHCELSEDDFKKIIKQCEQRGIDFLVTPFSVRWVEFFVDMRVAAFKVGSGNLAAVGLLEAIGQAGLPVIVSTGMANMEEVDRTLNQLREAGCGSLAVLHCVSLYPTKLEQANLRAIGTLAKHTELPVGFSDHTEQIITAALAVAAGAVILEKHLTLDKTLDGPDHKMSLEPQQLRQYIELAAQAVQAYGNGKKEPIREEMTIKETVRMSVASTVFLKKGTVITPEMVTLKRPGTGISPDRIYEVVGSTVGRDIKADRIIKPEDVIGWQKELQSDG